MLKASLWSICHLSSLIWELHALLNATAGLVGFCFKLVYIYLRTLQLNLQLINTWIDQMFTSPLLQPVARKVPLLLKRKADTTPLWPLVSNISDKVLSSLWCDFPHALKISSKLYTMHGVSLSPLSSSSCACDNSIKLADSRAAILDSIEELELRCFSEMRYALTIFRRFSLSGCKGTCHTRMSPAASPLKK